MSEIKDVNQIFVVCLFQVVHSPPQIIKVIQHVPAQAPPQQIIKVIQQAPARSAPVQNLRIIRVIHVNGPEHSHHDYHNEHQHHAQNVKIIRIVSQPQSERHGW